MLDNLRSMAVFANVVERGSFSGAAKMLGITTSAVSQQVRSLEEEMGVVLLHRSTRKISLTEAGDAFFKRCQSIVDIARQGRDELDSYKDDLTGEIRIATTPELAVSCIMPALESLFREHESFHVHFEADNHFIDLIDERIDIALRISQSPADATFVSQELATIEQKLVVSPEYLAMNANIAEPKDLTDHQLVTINLLKDPQTLSLTNKITGKKQRVKMPSRIRTNNVFITKSLAMQGQGVTRLMSVDVAKELAEGKLVEILPEWCLPSFKLYAVTLKHEHQTAKVSRTLELMRAYFADHQEDLLAFKKAC